MSESRSKVPFLERLSKGSILADGAMGTMLYSRGAVADTCFDELNLSRPALVRNIHSDYLRAGAELIETNTFGANRFKLAEHGLAGKLSDIIRAGVFLARQAIDEAGTPDAYIAASIGPLGVRLAPFGRVKPEQAYAAFHEQIEAVCEVGVDLLILETFSDLYEIAEAIRAARDVCPDMVLVAQMTFTRDDRTLMGDSAMQVARALADLGADVIGANCSNGPAQIMRIMRSMRSEVPAVPLSAMPNAGWPEYVGGRVMYSASPNYFAGYALALREQGVSVIGGCCGTTPEHIAAMQAALDDPLRVSPISVSEWLPESLEEEASPSAPSELAQKFAQSRFILSVEMSPPRGIGIEKTLQAAQMLHDAGADVIDVSDSPMARMRMSPWAVCSLLQSQASIETVLHFPTRGRNLLRIQGDLLAAHALGVRNLFVVMGDPTRIGDYPDAADNYDIVPSGLVRLIKKNLNQGLDWAGNKIGQPTNFLVSCALNLNAPDMDKEIQTLRKKLDGGADYLITQPIFERSSYERFVERYEALYGPLDVPILVGLLPLYSLRHALFLHNEVPGIVIPDPIMTRIEAAGDAAPQEGVQIALELAEQLKTAAGGLYLMPQFGRYDLVAEIIEAVR